VKADAPSARGEPHVARTQAKLSFKERRELDSLPAELEALEREQHELTTRMSATDYHKHRADAIRRDRARAAEIEHELAEKFERWAALDARAGAPA
jgi:ATP-binding cassette subfamily F protein uup